MRTTTDEYAIQPAVRAAIRAAAPELPAPAIHTYEELSGTLVSRRKFNMIVLALFGILAVAIAGVGIYGVMSYLVEQQTQEIGGRGCGPARCRPSGCTGAGAQDLACGSGHCSSRAMTAVRQNSPAPRL